MRPKTRRPYVYKLVGRRAHPLWSRSNLENIKTMKKGSSNQFKVQVDFARKDAVEALGNNARPCLRPLKAVSSARQTSANRTAMGAAASASAQKRPIPGFGSSSSKKKYRVSLARELAERETEIVSKACAQATITHRDTPGRLTYLTLLARQPSDLACPITHGAPPIICDTRRDQPR